MLRQSLDKASNLLLFVSFWNIETEENGAVTVDYHAYFVNSCVKYLK